MSVKYYFGPIQRQNGGYVHNVYFIDSERTPSTIHSVFHISKQKNLLAEIKTITNIEI